MKIKEFQKTLQNKKIDFALLYNIDSMNPDKDLIYFTGYKGIGALVIPKEKKPFMLVPEMELGRIKSKTITISKITKKKRLFEDIILRLKKRKISYKTIGINKNTVTLNIHKVLKKNFQKVKYKDIAEEIEKTREIKTEEEIKKIKKACEIGDIIFKGIIKGIKNKKLKTELDIRNFMLKEAIKKGSEFAFEPIVASGKGASIAHYEPKNIPLRKGFLVMDFGFKYQNYNSDMTRTIYIGKPSKKEELLYNFLLEIQERTIERIKEGDSCEGIYESVHEGLGSLSEQFNHGLGHGIGIKVHELPNLSFQSKNIIEKNKVFTIEPGIYLYEKYGIRIEDTIVMKNKPIRLTKSPKGLIILP